MNQFLWGANAALCFVAAMFFARFWQKTRDGLFLAFAAGFGALAAHWTGLGLFAPGSETRHYHYLVRLLAFALIILGVVAKNRSSRLPRPPTAPAGSLSTSSNRTGVPRPPA